MVTTAPLPPVPDTIPTWNKAAQLARKWGLQALSERLAGLTAAD
jgi:hypothetical protein